MKKTARALATLILSLALPFTAYASHWTQDAMGWKVQADDGIYLTNQWYQSPESGLFYYIGADGYMMINATTPDGYQVNAEGVWVEQPAPQPTQSKPEINNPVQQPEVNNNTNTDTTGKPADVSEQEWQEWLEFEESIKGGTGKVNEIEIQPGEAGYDDSGEINIGGGY